MSHTPRAGATGPAQDLTPDQLQRARIGELEARIAADAVERRVVEDALRQSEAHLERQAAALQRALDTAIRASETKSEFLAMMSHELRTPLTGVIGYSELLTSEVLGPLNEKQQDALARIRTSTWHLVGLIDEILTLSRTEAGRETARRETTDIAAVTRDVLRLLRPQAPDSRLEFHCRGTDTPELIESDAGKIRQILINLVGNAVKFTAEGAVTVELERGPTHVRIHVRDTGPGIEAADQARIFEAFTQADSSSTRTAPGVGLGLAISRRLALLLGGDVTLQSEPGVGSTFTLELPRDLEA
jgi:signal transduction histidine kinase